MITYLTGNMLLSSAEALVNPVNCVGVMGRGLAKQFKEIFPDNFYAYREACTRNDVLIGRMFTFFTGTQYIINFPTKSHWKAESKLSYIDLGLIDLAYIIMKKKISSVAIPRLGCGEGGLDWAIVKPRIEAALRLLHNTQVFIYSEYKDGYYDTDAD